MRVHIGTSGFYYRQWAGSFYPEDTRRDRLLEYYSTRLGTVEINSSFYRMPPALVLKGWAGQVPSGFVFSIKAPSYITHKKRLKDASENMLEFYAPLKAAKKKYRVALFQLPPSLKPDLGLLSDFIYLLDPELINVFEFRHGGWLNGGVYDLLSSRGAAVCTAVKEVPCEGIMTSGGVVYARFHGNKKGKYSKRELARQLEALLKPGLDVYIYFNNDSVYAMENALTMKELYEG